MGVTKKTQTSQNTSSPSQSIDTAELAGNEGIGSSCKTPARQQKKPTPADHPPREFRRRGGSHHEEGVLRFNREEGRNEKKFIDVRAM
jgi:hypothetical protein